MKNYDFKADIWSCGVILYILLSGRPPFNADNDLEIMRMIKIGKYSMQSRIWDKVSTHAKDLVKGMLCYDPKKRLTANQALNHMWFLIEKQPEDLADVSQIQRQDNILGQQIRKKNNMFQLSKQEI